jgi:hypothetical protein
LPCSPGAIARQSLMTTDLAANVRFQTQPSAANTTTSSE